MTLDEIAAAAEQLKRDQQRQQIAKMADELITIQAEDWKAPEGVEHAPDPWQPKPLDWLLQEQIAKAKREGETHHIELEAD
jgi:hypothetical protein